MSILATNGSAYLGKISIGRHEALRAQKVSNASVFVSREGIISTLARIDCLLSFIGGDAGIT